jgi:hypothetical protein
MFDASTLDYVYSEKVLEHLTADKEKPWAEWSRSKPISEKGVATLLHEYRIRSRNVGPKEQRGKGYRRADFADAWKRYCEPGEGVEEGGGVEEGLKPADLPFTRPPPCNDSAFGKKSAVHQNPVDGKNLANSPAVSTPCTGERENGVKTTPSAAWVDTRRAVLRSTDV